MSAAAKPAAKKAASKKAAGTSVSYEVSSILHAHARCRNYVRARVSTCMRAEADANERRGRHQHPSAIWMDGTRARVSRWTHLSKIIYCAASPPWDAGSSDKHDDDSLLTRSSLFCLLAIV